MALNKGKSMKWLLFHTVVYSLCFFPFGPSFVLFTLLTHTLTDALTSQMTSKNWFIELTPVHENYKRDDMFHVKVDDAKRHWFFVWIGFDQLIHFTTLAYTFRYFAS